MIPKNADAALFLEQDLSQIPRDAGMHLLAIPLSKGLASIYRAGKIEPSEAQGLGVSSPLDTVKVATLLTSFDWKTTQSRYLPVSRFVGEFFKALPALTREHPNSIWLETDVRANVPGWERFSAADALRKTVKLNRPEGAEVRFAAKVEPPLRTEDAIRTLVSPRPPFADQEQPGGGLVAELFTAALKLAGAEQGMQAAVTMTWAKDQAEQLDTLIKDESVRAAIAWDGPDCDNPEDLGPTSVVLCDNAILSDTIFQSVVVLFIRADSNLDFKDNTSLDGKTLCVPESDDSSDLNRDGRHWISEKKVILVRPNTLAGCIGLVVEGKADGVLMHELEGRIALQRLGISQAFRVAERPIAVRGIHAIAAKNNPRGVELISRLNEGLSRLKRTGAYAQIVQKQLSPLWRQTKADAAQ